MDKEERQKRITECKTLEELQVLGEELGYKPGWAVHVMESRKGYGDPGDE
jgi:hypothetical protein